VPLQLQSFHQVTPLQDRPRRAGNTSTDFFAVLGILAASRL
jgi:hypothetical protein